jgi:hypothetical protein
MATQIVMDHSGDSRHFFDTSDADALAEAERLFLEFTSKGYTAAVRTSPGEVTRITTFLQRRKRHCFSRGLWAGEHK